MEVLLAIIIGLVVVALLTLIFKAHNPWNRYWAILLLVTLAGWFGGIWVIPFGPVIWGLYILPFFILSIIFGLLIASTGPHEPTDHDTEEPLYTQEELGGKRATIKALNIYFWTLVFFMLLMIALRYLWIL